MRLVKQTLHVLRLVGLSGQGRKCSDVIKERRLVDDLQLRAALCRILQRESEVGLDSGTIYASRLTCLTGSTKAWHKV